MAADLQNLKFVRDADVYKNGLLAGALKRTDSGSVEFSYNASYLMRSHPPIASTLPLSNDVVAAPSGALPPFFAGLLPEGHRLSVLKNAAKTSYSDELTLILAVGADAPGDVQVVPAGETPAEPDSLADTSHPADLDFAALADAVDRHSLPGVQNKASASMLTTPLALKGKRYLLKLDPTEYPHLVANEATHLAGAMRLKIPVASATVISDRSGAAGLLVERFDRIRGFDESSGRLPLEDGTQVLGLPPASKYGVTAEQVTLALTRLCAAPIIAIRNAYLQFAFAWLTGNGDLHAKNISILGNMSGAFAMAPVYDVPCTLLYGDNTLALPLAGKNRNLRAAHWAEFADSLGLPQKAAAAANQIALTAATAIRLDELPFTGSPLNQALRELRSRRSEFAS